MQLKQQYILEFIQQLMENYNVPVNRLKTPFSNIEPLGFGLRSDMLEQPDISYSIEKFFQNLKTNTIYFLNDIFECNYIIFYHPTEQFLFCIGPFLTARMTKHRLDKLFDKLELSEVLRFPLTDYYERIPFISPPDFVENMFIQLGKNLYGNDSKPVYMDLQKKGHHPLNYDALLRLPKKTFSETDMIAKSYELESTFIAAVSVGSAVKAYELAQSLFEMSYIDMPPAGFELRYHKNYLISISAILRKIIEYGGIHPIYFHDLYRNSFADIEHCTSHNQLDELLKIIIFDYCKVIKTTRHGHHPQVIETILAYIDADLRADLTLKAFSKYLNLTPSYLSDLFSKEMGISLTNYVTQKRMDMAKLLLGMTTLSVKTVAENCGFSDIQYFNRTFRKYTGLTPKVYHNTYYYPNNII